MAKTVCDFIAGKVKNVDAKHFGGCFVEDPQINRTASLSLWGGSWEKTFVDFGITADEIPVSPVTGQKDRGEALFPCVEDWLTTKSVKNRFWGLFHQHKNSPNPATAREILHLGQDMHSDRELPNLEMVETFFQRIPAGQFTHDDLVMGLKKTTIFF